MGAFVDRTVRCIVSVDSRKRAAGALPIGNSFLFETEDGRFIAFGEPKIEPPRRHHDDPKTWLICRHLDRPDKFISNYLKNRYFVVFDSHVFCHDCNENNMRGGEAAFLNMEKQSSALSDEELRGQIFDPFFELNLRFGGRNTLQKDVDRYPRNWCVCKHLASEDSFRRHVFDGNLILFADYKVTCPDCLDIAVKGPHCHDEDQLVSMPDDHVRHAIVETLYSLNYELSMAQGFIGSQQ